MERIKQLKVKQFSETRLTVYTGLFVCFGIILPFITSHAYGLKGNVFLPMHIPVILCGFFCGTRRGALCGFITPILSSLMTDMPAAYPMLPIMTAELTMYGFMSGFLFSRGVPIGPSLTVAMFFGRACYAITFYLLLIGDPSLKLGPNPILSSMPVVSALMIGIPGMIIQLTLVPLIVKQLILRQNKRKK